MQRRHESEPEKAEKGKGGMTVEEAGRLGGHKGGQRVKQLIEDGKRGQEENQDIAAREDEDLEEDEEEEE